MGGLEATFGVKNEFCELFFDHQPKVNLYKSINFIRLKKFERNR